MLRGQYSIARRRIRQPVLQGARFGVAHGLALPLRSGYNGRMSRRTGFDARRFARSQEVRLVVGFFVILYLVGGPLIWHFYGAGGALLALLCMTGALVFFLLLYGLVSLLGIWANRDYS